MRPALLTQEVASTSYAQPARSGRCGARRSPRTCSAAAAAAAPAIPRVPEGAAQGQAEAEMTIRQLSPREKLTKARLITAVKTPYQRNGKFDLAAYDTLVEHQIENGVEGLIVGGTTGEGQLMSWDEHVMLIAHTVNRFGRDLLVIGNTGSNSTREALHATTQGFAVGMHASLQINPYYGKTSERGLLHHLNAVLDEGPGIIYNVPARTAQDIPDRVVEQLAGHEHFLGMKECTGTERIQNYTQQGIRCWSGNDDDCHTARHECGGQGVISVTSNVVPSLMSSLMLRSQPQLDDRLQRLMSWMFSEPNPIALNTALAMCGAVQPVFRLPYMPLTRAQREQGAALLQEFREFLPGNGNVRVMEDDEFKILSNF